MLLLEQMIFFGGVSRGLFMDANSVILRWGHISVIAPVQKPNVLSTEYICCKGDILYVSF